MADVPVVDAQETVDLQQKEGFTYLDVRTQDEFSAGHAPGAVCIPVMLRGEAGMQPNPAFLELAKAKFPSDSKLVLACASGKRSTMASEMLHQAGYTQLRNFAGSWAAWTAAGLPVVTGS